MSTKEVTKKKGKVVQRNYVMKDVGALRKSWGTKLKHLQKNEDIGDVENDEAAKGATDTAHIHGQSDVSHNQVHCLHDHMPNHDPTQGRALWA